MFLKEKSINEIQNIIEEYKLKKMIIEFRHNALCFGYEINNYTDLEILQMVKTSSEKISKCGISAEEANNALSELSRLMTLS